MRFHFRSHDHHNRGGLGGVVVPDGDHEHGGSSGEEGSPANDPLASKLALHLERRGSECPASAPDRHTRRHFFRLGRHRPKGIGGAASRPASPPCVLTSDSSDDEPGGSERAARATVARARRSRGVASPRKPKLRRAQSAVVGPSTAAATRGLVAIPSCPYIEATSSFDAMDYSSSSTDAVTVTYPPEKDKSSCSEPVTRRRVTFTSVQIREYSTVLGDHPCCPSGPPLSLGWELIHEDLMELDKYEKVQEPARAKCKGDMRLGEKARRDILRSLVVVIPTSSLGAGGGDSDDDHHGTALYSRKELCRAERRLSRDRANLNSRSQRRMNKGFFRPLTSTEECVMAGAGSGVATAEAAREEAEKEKDSTTGEKELESHCSEAEKKDSTSSAVDISSIKPSATG